MPNPEISQYKDNDTNTTYDLKDATARADLATVQADIRKSIISISTMANGQDDDYTDWLFMSALNKGLFAGQDQAFVRIHFNSELVDYTKPVRFIYYFDETHGPGVYICNVVTNYKTMQNLAGHYKQGDVLDFIFYKYTYTFVLVGPSDSADLSNYYTKTETDSLLNAKVSDNPTFTEATTRANIASGETFAVILGKIKKFFADLKTVAFTGSYNDLTNTPTIPAAQVNADWSASSGVAQILNKPNLATVATSGEYNDLNNRPTLARVASTGEYSDLNNKPTLATVAETGEYSDLNNKPVFAPVATSGDYNDLGNKLTAGYNVNITSNNAIIAYNRNILINGAQQPLHTKTDDTDINLVDGANVSINNVNGDFEISATDTKPSNMTTDNSPAAVSVGSSNNWQCITSSFIFSAQAGEVWLVQIALQFQANASGLRGIGLNGSNSTEPSVIFKHQVPAVTTSGTVTNLTFCSFVKPSSNTNYYIWARQNSGQSLNVTYRYRAIKLL